MLETADLGKKVSEKEFKPRAKELRSRLSALQQPIKQKKLPVLILLEGWDAAGKGN
jgi:polyphosphate kinase 2 (PPK2 family)